MRKSAFLTMCVVGAVGAVLALAPGVARAESALLGIILVSDAGTVSNVTTGYGSSASTSGAQAFIIPTNAQITTQCDSAVYYDSADCGVDGGRGIRLAADQLYPDSTGAGITCRRADAGTYVGGVVAIQPVSGATAKCWVRPRRGTE